LDRLLSIFGRGNAISTETKRLAKSSNRLGAKHERCAGCDERRLRVHPAARQILDVSRPPSQRDAGYRGTATHQEHGTSPQDWERDGAPISDYPDAIANTAEISDQLPFELSDFGYEFTRYPVPNGQSEIDLLTKLGHWSRRCCCFRRISSGSSRVEAACLPIGSHTH